MRRLGFAVVGFCLALAPGVAAATSEHAGDDHWIKDSNSGCWIYNPTPQGSAETISWNGPECYFDSEANGRGSVTWYLDNRWMSVETGQMVHGYMEGSWERRYANGNVTNDMFVDSQLQTPGQDYASQTDDTSGSSSTYTPVYNGDEYMETLRRQNRENCERAAQGYDVPCHPE